MRTLFVFISLFIAESTLAGVISPKQTLSISETPALTFLSPSRLEILQTEEIGLWEDIEYA